MLPMSRTPTVVTLYKFNEVDGGLAQIQYSVVQGSVNRRNPVSTTETGGSTTCELSHDG
jgi:hypothetical protein